jgi:PKD repeat protein
MTRNCQVPLACAVVLLCGMLASAATYMRTTLKELTTRAIGVAEVEVLAKNYPAMQPGDAMPRTHVEVKVLRSFKGALPEKFVLDLPGGINGDVVTTVPDGPEFKMGERAVVFVKEVDPQHFMVQDLGLGKFNIVERDGQDFVESQICPKAMPIDSRAENADEASLLTRSIPYDLFCGMVRDYAAGKEAEIDAGALAPKLMPSSSHLHNQTPLAVSDARAMRQNAREQKAWLTLALGLFFSVLAMALWLRRRRHATAAVSKRTIMLMMCAGLLAGAALGGGVSHAYVTFDQGTIWDLDTPISGKVASQRVIWRQSTATAKDNSSCFNGVTNSFNKWENVASSRLAFTNGGSSSLTTNSTSDGQNVIAWTTTPSNDFSSSTLAITFSSFTVGTTSSFLDGDIIFNDKNFNWSSGGSGNVDSVSLHEIGHFIGLNHTTSSATVMFPFDGGLTALSSDEIAAAQALYPGTDGTPLPTGGPNVSAQGSPTSGLPPLLVGLTGTATVGTSGSPIASYSWNFGDGQTSSTANVSHTYTASGSYTATLTVTDAAGATGTASVAITVGDLADPQKAAFKLNFTNTGKDNFSATLYSEQLLGIKDDRGTGTVSQGYVNIGAQSYAIEYDTEKGRTTSSSGMKVTVNDKKGTITIKITSADLLDVLAAYGADNTTVTDLPVTVPVEIWLGEGRTLLSADIDFLYKAKLDKTGSGKF